MPTNAPHRPFRKRPKATNRNGRVMLAAATGARPGSCAYRRRRRFPPASRRTTIPPAHASGLRRAHRRPGHRRRRHRAHRERPPRHRPRRRTRPRGVVRIERFIRIERLACFARGRPPKRNEGIVGCPRCRAARRPPFARNGRARFAFGVGLAGGRRPRTVPCLLRIRALPVLAHYSSSSMISASEPAPCGIAATPSDSRMRFSISRAISGFSRRNSRALSLPWPIFSPL